MIKAITTSQNDSFYYQIDQDEAIKIHIKGLPKSFIFSFDQVNEFLKSVKGQNFYIMNEIDNYTFLTFENWIINNTQLAPSLCEFIASVLVIENLIEQVDENLYRQI